MKFAPTILLLAMGALFATAETSTVPTFLSYQGRVIDSTGVLIGNAAPVNRTIQFRLYTAASGGTAIWGEAQVATISAGEFSVLIGNGAGIAGLNGPFPPAATPYKTIADIINSTDAPSLYIGITVDDGNASTTEVEIIPRQQIVAGAFALRAKVAESVATSAITSSMIGLSEVGTSALQTSAVTNVKIADAAVTSTKIADSNIMASHLAASAVTAAKIDTSTVGLWSVSGTSIYRASGNVAIGTLGASFPLTFAASVGDKIALYGGTAGVGHFGLGVQSGLLQIHSDASTSDVAFGYGTSSNFSETLRIKGTGFVGIGITTPTFPLTFAGTVGDKISLYGAGNYGFGVQLNTLQIHGNTSADDVVFGYGTSGAFTETMRVKGSGKVGIGVTTPTYNLQVAGTFYATGNSTIGGRLGVGTSTPNAPLHVNGTAVSYNYYKGIIPTSAKFQIIADGNILASSYEVNSDARIKTALHLSDQSADLQTLLGIQITDYRLLDTISGGQGSQKKVIAQQVERVYPQAVTQSRGVIPDIYKAASSEDGWVFLQTDLKAGDRVRIIGATETTICEVLEVAFGKFRTDFKQESETIFVYGREVNDFRTVDYDALAMLNVSATQALYRRQESERQRTAALKQKVSELETGGSQKDARISALEARLLALEKVIGTSK